MSIARGKSSCRVRSDARSKIDLSGVNRQDLLVNGEGGFEFAIFFQTRAFDKTSQGVGLALGGVTESEIRRRRGAERVVERSAASHRQGSGGFRVFWRRRGPRRGSADRQGARKERARSRQRQSPRKPHVSDSSGNLQTWQRAHG